MLISTRSRSKISATNAPLVLSRLLHLIDSIRCFLPFCFARLQTRIRRTVSHYSGAINAADRRKGCSVLRTPYSTQRERIHTVRQERWWCSTRTGIIIIILFVGKKLSIDHRPHRPPIECRKLGVQQNIKYCMQRKKAHLINVLEREHIVRGLKRGEPLLKINNNDTSHSRGINPQAASFYLPSLLCPNVQYVACANN